MNLDRVTMAMIIAQAQSLQLMFDDVTSGDCADCQCSTCISLRGMAQMARS